MISFACAGCGQKLQVPNEVAGKAVRCSLCKHVMTIAAPVALPPTVLVSQIDGPPSSLARAGLNGGVTVGPQGSDSSQESPTPPPDGRLLRDILAHGAAGGQRYQVAGEIARGGMGVVLRAVDCDIRREVAVKYLLDQADARKKARFVEEAQIAGQLEHPNIVPVHELGIDAHKRLFFSMKMVRGRSLAEVLREMRDTPRSSEKEYTLNRLLNIFVNICHPLAYAHARGVVHRDLKPANIMLGDFGEVYVMDWGLAKVLHRPAAPKEPTGVIQTMPSFAWAEEAAGGMSSATVQTSRQKADDQTVDGTVMGTAVYMPPEQARGDIAAIDPRSDVYSLGALLYEILTLHPPVDKAGGFRAILGCVVRGEILPPQEREPARARAGKIPPELAAIAMKALALKPEDRYQTVEALRGDIERFLEGRSVSVKEDTRRELLIKFVRRNKGFSLGAAAALLILLLSSIFLLQAWLSANRSHKAYLQEQEAKRAQARQSVPVLVEAARFAVQRRKFEDALAQVNMALDYAPDHGGARLLKGQLLAARKDFAAARPELEHYLKLQPGDGEAARLARLCAQKRPDDPAAPMELADILLRQDLPTLAEGLLDAPDKLLAVYRRKIEAAWPGLGGRLTMVKDGNMSLNLSSCKEVLNLTPLQGMPLRSLYLSQLKIRDLSPLQGMPLTFLYLAGCKEIADLKPLAGMPLTYLDLSSCGQVAGLSPLRGMKLTFLALSGCQVADLKPLAGMPLTNLELSQCSQVKDLAPLRGMKLTSLNLYSCKQVGDLAPLTAMPLAHLELRNCGPIRDLTPLAGMPLKKLMLGYSGRITDLRPLADLPLTELTLSGFPHLNEVMLPRITTLTGLHFESCGGIEDVTPLKGPSLTSVSFLSCEIKDVTLLKGLPLTHLSFNSCGIADLTPLAGMPLTHLIFATVGPIADLTPLKGMPLTHLTLGGCDKVADLTPLEGMNLRQIGFSARTVKKGVVVLRRMKSLEGINGLLPADFWKKYDAGEFQSRP